jgi:hypothetical protein
MAIIQSSISAVDALCHAAAVLVAGGAVASRALIGDSCAAAGHLTLSSLADTNRHARTAMRKWRQEPMKPHHPDYDAAWGAAVAAEQ